MKIGKTGRRAAGISVLCALALTASACDGGGGSSGRGSRADAGTPVTGGTLNVLGTSDVTYTDPNVSYYSVDYMSMRMWSRSLFTNPAKEGETDTAVPDMATRMPTIANGGVSEDGLTYTITMRDGIAWNTKPERPVTATDFVRGMKRTCNPVQPMGGIPDFASLFVGYQAFCDRFAKVGTTARAIGDFVESNDIPGITAADERTIVFKLTRPAVYLPAMLTLPSLTAAPVEYNRFVPASAQLAQNTISDGPYQLTSYEPTKSMVYERNPAWKASTDPIRKAYVDTIKVDLTMTQESTQQQLETGTPTADMTFAGHTPSSRVPALIAEKDPNLVIGATNASNPYLLFNTASPNENGALGKLQVRQALQYGINRDHLIQVTGGKVLNNPLSRIIPPSLPAGRSGDFDLYPYDPEKARRLLADAGYRDGLTLRYLYRPAAESEVKSFSTIKQDLTKIGITISGIQAQEADFYVRYLMDPEVARRGVWDLASSGWNADWFGTGSELSYFKPLFAGKPSFPPIGSNFGLYDSTSTNELIARAVSATTAEESQALFAKADEQVMRDAAIFPITNPKEPTYHAPQVHNAVYVGLMQGFDPTNVWLDKDKQGG